MTERLLMCLSNGTNGAGRLSGANRLGVRHNPRFSIPFQLEYARVSFIAFRMNTRSRFFPSQDATCAFWSKLFPVAESRLKPVFACRAATGPPARFRDRFAGCQ